MGYNMKHGNKKMSYGEIFNKSNQMATDATEAERDASIEEEKVNGGGPPFKEQAPTKMWGKIVDTAIGALKEDTAAAERANNRNVQVASIQRK